MNANTERILLKSIIGLLVPVTLFVATLFWVAAVNFYFFQYESLYLFTPPLLALAAGIGLVFFHAERWARDTYRWSLLPLAGLLIFYAIGLFGVFMGVPVFHVLFAIPAGLYMGRRIFHEQADEERRSWLTRRTCCFTTGLMTLVCLASATIALLDRYTISNLQGMMENMFGIHFITVTPGFVISLIVFGGIGLVVLEYYLTKTAIGWAYKWE